MPAPKIDFQTMRENCIQIYQEAYEIEVVCKSVGISSVLPFPHEQLKENTETKSWDGLGRWAKKIYDDAVLWAKLPNVRNIHLINGINKKWSKEEARKSLLDCFEELGGQLLYNT